MLGVTAEGVGKLSCGPTAICWGIPAVITVELVVSSSSKSFAFLFGLRTESPKC